MATGRDRTKRMLRVGLFALLGFVILVVGVFVIGDKQNMFNPTFTVYSDFTSVEGLKPGALVRINGIKVGSVSKVELKLDSASFVRVTMIIDDDARKFVRTTTVASVAQQGLIGDKQIELSVTAPTAPIVANGAHLQSSAPTNYTAIFEDARTAVKNTEGITASLDTLFLRFRRGEGTLGKLLTDDEAYLGLTRVTSATERLLNQTSSQLASVTATLNRAALNVDDITNESKKLVADIGNGKGTVGALLYDRSLYDSLESLTGTLNDAAGSASFAAREFGINMRGLRSSWLGGLFRGDEQQEEQSAMMQREVEIRLEELKRQKELLDRREREMMAKEKQSQR
ncbi:MAG TPA: MlaD family protein [Candidatus Kapabacteria bacterium]|nr:MlaD family protein [Candidatus Kapabacteria bacterium]